MDVALDCAHCGAPATGTRFCTSCGGVLPVVAQVPPPREESDAAALTAVDAPAGAPVVLAPWAGAEEPGERPRPRRDVLGFVVVAALLLSCWAMVRGVEQHTVSGTVTILDEAYLTARPGARCTGVAGYGDVGPGAQVVVADQSGETVSTGRLSRGEFDGLGCVFSFVLEDVTRSDFYGLTVGDGHRGELQYSYEELSSADWSVQLSLGGD